MCGSSSNRLERKSARLEAASSNLVSRSKFSQRVSSQAGLRHLLFNQGNEGSNPSWPIKSFSSGYGVGTKHPSPGNSWRRLESSYPDQSLQKKRAAGVDSCTLALQARRLSASLRRSTNQFRISECGLESKSLFFFLNPQSKIRIPKSNRASSSNEQSACLRNRSVEV